MVDGLLSALDRLAIENWEGCPVKLPGPKLTRPRVLATRPDAEEKMPRTCAIAMLVAGWVVCQRWTGKEEESRRPRQVFSVSY